MNKIEEFWTDYPILELGDKSGKISPIRQCKPVAYDGDKYCLYEVDGLDSLVEFKRWYAYPRRIRLDDMTESESTEMNDYISRLPLYNTSFDYICA